MHNYIEAAKILQDSMKQHYIYYTSQTSEILYVKLDRILETDINTRRHTKPEEDLSKSNQFPSDKISS